MKVFTKEIVIWFLVNIISPIIVPLGFALLLNLLWHTGKSISDMVEMLWKGGAYIFLSLFVLFSLMPHFFEDKKPDDRVLWVYIGITFLVFIITCFLYLSYLSLIQSDKAATYDENLQVSIIVTVGGVMSAIVFKVLILLKKLNQDVSYNNKLTNKKQ